MQRLGVLSVASIIVCLSAALAEPSNQFNGLLGCLSDYLWVFPFSASIISISLSIVNMILGVVVPRGVPGKLLSGAYLMTGPSLALLGISISIGMAAPIWVTFVIPTMLPMSAWAYYKSLGPLEDNEMRTTDEPDQVEDEIWSTEIRNNAVKSLE